jgi:hypothetical protein
LPLGSVVPGRGLLERRTGYYHVFTLKIHWACGLKIYVPYLCYASEDIEPNSHIELVKINGLKKFFLHTGRIVCPSRSYFIIFFSLNKKITKCKHFCLIVYCFLRWSDVQHWASKLITFVRFVT